MQRRRRRHVCGLEMAKLETARQIMLDFGIRTGLSDPNRAPARYLWTDAYAVCNYLELFQWTGNENWKDQALTLVQQVHQALGRYRADDQRTGWISGLSDFKGERHPTAGGLRIGKPLPERRPQEPPDERLEWERDGQYFHYLTKWMQALNHVTEVTGETSYNHWAIELAQAAHARFTDRTAPDRPPRMYWKMSIDLSRPLVTSRGHLDPLDALVTYQLLCSTAVRSGHSAATLELSTEVVQAAEMCAGNRWITHDALGIGGLLNCACILAGLPDDEPQRDELLQTLLEDAVDSLEWWWTSHPLHEPAVSRLAFRELGLAIGLHDVRRMLARIVHARSSIGIQFDATALHELERYLPLIEAIEQFWMTPVHQRCETWTAHYNINFVMLATSLLREPIGETTPTQPPG
jgi:hypothetical protein